MNTKLRFYTNNVGPIAENESLAWTKAVELSKQRGNIEEITLLIHTKSNTGYIDRVFGREYVDRLFQGAVAAYKGGPRVKLETLRTFDSTTFHVHDKTRILIGYGLDSKELFEYDQDPTIYAIIGHQWYDGGVREWAEAWGAFDLVSGDMASRISSIDPVVKEALDSLTKTINMSTGISHTSDDKRCKTYLRALYKYGYRLDAVEIKSYLMTNLKWTGKHADQVIRLVNILNEGRYFQGGERTGLQHYIKTWKSRLE